MIPKSSVAHPIHTGNHPCTFCQRIFKSVESVRLHEKAVHKKQMKKMLNELKGQDIKSKIGDKFK